MFTVTDVRNEDQGANGSIGASFKHSPTGYVFHAFVNPVGTFSFTGMVPEGLAGGHKTLKAATDAVAALNTGGKTP